MIHYVNGSILYNMKQSKCRTETYDYVCYFDSDKTKYNNGNTLPATFYTTRTDSSGTCTYFAKGIKAN